MAPLLHRAWPAGSLPIEEKQACARPLRELWLALQMLDPPADLPALTSLADWAESLTSKVVLRPDEGLLLEVRGSLKYFAGLDGIRQRLAAELERRGWICRLATAPTPLAAAWLARCKSVDVSDQGALASVIGSLPLTVTGWPGKVQQMLGQMGLNSLADCMRLPRAGFARRVGRAWLDELDRALGRQPDPRTPHRTARKLQRAVEFAIGTSDRALIAEALSSMADSLERELRQQQMQVTEVELRFGHLRAGDTRTRIGFVDPVHERERILKPLLARLERIALSEPAVSLSLETSMPLPLKTALPDLLCALPGSRVAKGQRAVPEFALVECLRGRFGARRVYGIGTVAAHRPEHAWRHWIERPAAAGAARQDESDCPLEARPLWLLPEPQKAGESPFCFDGIAGGFDHEQRFSRHAVNPSLGAPRAHPCARGSRKPLFALEPLGSSHREEDSGPLFVARAAAGVERIESGWWDGGDVRRDYHVVIGPAGEKLWFYRDCATHEWYLHGIFG